MKRSLTFKEPDVEAIRQWQEERDRAKETAIDKLEKPETPEDYAMKIADTDNLSEKKQLLLNLNGQYGLEGRQKVLNLLRLWDDTFAPRANQYDN